MHQERILKQFYTIPLPPWLNSFPKTSHSTNQPTTDSSLVRQETKPKTMNFKTKNVCNLFEQVIVVVAVGLWREHERKYRKTKDTICMETMLSSIIPNKMLCRQVVTLSLHSNVNLVTSHLSWIMIFYMWFQFTSRITSLLHLIRFKVSLCAKQKSLSNQQNQKLRAWKETKTYF